MSANMSTSISGTLSISMLATISSTGRGNFVIYQNHVGHHVHLHVDCLSDGDDLLGDGGDHLDGDKLHNIISTLFRL